MSIFTRLFALKSARPGADQSCEQREKFCQDSWLVFQKHFDAFMQTHGYAKTFLGRRGRYGSECLFGLDAPGKPRLVFGGEIGPDIWIGSSTSSFAAIDNPETREWFNIGPLTDFVLGHGPLWLDRAGVSRDFDEGCGELFVTVSTIWPQLIQMFASQSTIDAWGPDFDAFATKAVEAWSVGT